MSRNIIEEAKNHPNDWVYEIDNDIDPDRAVPPEKYVMRGKSTTLVL